MKRILFVGDLNDRCRSFQRFETFSQMGMQVTGLSWVPVRKGRTASGPD